VVGQDAMTVVGSVREAFLGCRAAGDREARSLQRGGAVTMRGGVSRQAETGPVWWAVTGPARAAGPLVPRHPRT
jgi:hypothetical protein